MLTSKHFSILGRRIEPGEKLSLDVDIARLHTRTKLEVPVVVARGKEPGPCLLLLSGIHGNEVNGVEIVRQIIAKKLHIPKRGAVIAIPVLNVFGFLNQSREFPDGRDLNRVFPGSKKGPLASRFAHFIMSEIIPHIDYCIDFHTGGNSRFNYPQIRIAEDDEETLHLAKIFGSKFVFLAPHRDKSFRSSVSEYGKKKVLLFEGGKTMDLNYKVTQKGIDGYLRVMKELGLRDELRKESTAPEESIIIKSSQWLRSPHSGLFRTEIRNGEFVEKGKILGSVSDPFGDFEKRIKATNSGYIFCINESPIINQGDALMHISTKIIEP